jgi:ribosomal protein S18 acetylase RimI-like enzyme
MCKKKMWEEDSMSVEIREMTIDDYDQSVALWQVSQGVELSNADSRGHIEAFLQRNPGLSCVACDGPNLVGTVLCGHDGRRGYLHHLAVSQSHRGQGIGRTLAARALTMLRRHGIDKCHIFVVKKNREAIAFWKRIGWIERVELLLMSQLTPPSS